MDLKQEKLLREKKEKEWADADESKDKEIEKLK